MATKIEWVKNRDGSQGVSWNPIRAVGGGHWCRKISPGCANCYAERLQPRFKGPKSYTAKDKPGLYLDERILEAPLRWRKPRTVFVCSMTDLFGSWVPDDWLDKIFAVMAVCQDSTFQVLTKRPRRMPDYMAQIEAEKDLQRWINAANDWGAWPEDAVEWCPQNIWLGFSAEDQRRFDERIGPMLELAAAGWNTWASLEPLLGPIALDAASNLAVGDFEFSVAPEFTGLRWVVTGGESGPKARPSHPDWFRAIRDQCVAAGVPYFHKQAGEWADKGEIGDGWERTRAKGETVFGRIYRLGDDYETRLLFDGREFETVYPWPEVNSPGPCMVKVGKKAAGRLLDGREWNQTPEGWR